MAIPSFGNPTKGITGSKELKALIKVELIPPIPFNRFLKGKVRKERYPKTIKRKEKGIKTSE